MAYIGQKPATTITVPTSQSFNGDGSTTAFTLNKGVTVGEELEVFVDNVQQQPGSTFSYTATGTTLTFDEAPPTGTDNVYVIYRGQSNINTRLEHSLTRHCLPQQEPLAGRLQLTARQSPQQEKR